MNLLRKIILTSVLGRKLSWMSLRNYSSISNLEPVENPYWREAASLIITARDKGIDFGQTVAQSRVDDYGSQKGKLGDHRFDYRVLLLERNKNLKFRGGTDVFPGGAPCEADFSIEWANVFTYVQKRDLGDIISELNIGRKKPPILSTVRHSGIPPELGYRIAAIRETFELSGVLLVKGARMPMIEDTVIDEFRTKVKKDPRKFATYCKELSVVPDIWSLQEWVNWLTPVFPGQEVKEAPAVPRRFDTIFYLCCLDWIPLVQCDGKETSDAKWVTPDHVFSSPDRKLDGPLAFELARISNFEKLSTLHTFASQRSTLGLERYMPVYFKCQDGILGVLPGDDLYPESPDLQGIKPAKSLPHTLHDLREVTRCHHRQELPDGQGTPFYTCSTNLRYGQPVPHKDFFRYEGII